MGAPGPAWRIAGRSLPSRLGCTSVSSCRIAAKPASSAARLSRGVPASPSMAIVVPMPMRSRDTPAEACLSLAMDFTAKVELIYTSARARDFFSEQGGLTHVDAGHGERQPQSRARLGLHARGNCAAGPVPGGLRGPLYGAGAAGSRSARKLPAIDDSVAGCRLAG